jgi:hypothetical protein
MSATLDLRFRASWWPRKPIAEANEGLVSSAASDDFDLVVVVRTRFGFLGAFCFFTLELVSVWAETYVAGANKATLNKLAKIA